jgi:hypothetical protein
VGPPAYRMTIDRIRVEHGEMDFADHSLALPFGTRIHDFKGAFNGISTQTGALAELELDGRVDEFGLARAVGQIDLFNPTGFMDIKTVFRNVEMTNLTPYTATFVGRKIQSGKLSLDLEYKIKERQLLGENQIIMDKLTLGERVESPTAKDLPLDLAIAILQDSDGKIDLGLPVSGSLDDPQFSYGRIIWKAIGNIITKIVTAPFRALGALFGGGGEKLEKVAFEAGEAGLTPPEKEKFKQISQILNKRPGLALTVHGAWSAEIDRPALKELQLRRAVAEKMGVKLAPDEDPGPISTSNAKAQAGLEAPLRRPFRRGGMEIAECQVAASQPGEKEGIRRGQDAVPPEEPVQARGAPLPRGFEPAQGRRPACLAVQATAGKRSGWRRDPGPTGPTPRPGGGGRPGCRRRSLRTGEAGRYRQIRWRRPGSSGQTGTGRGQALTPAPACHIRAIGHEAAWTASLKPPAPNLQPSPISLIDPQVSSGYAVRRPVKK